MTILNVVLLDYIEITGSSTVDENSGAQYECTAYFDNGDSSIVTNSCNWSDNSVYASISIYGYLTTYDVSHVDRPCTISASYGGKSDNISITIENVLILNSISISGLTNVQERSGSQYSATAHWDDSSATDITYDPSIVWSENSPYATISSTGYLTTLDVGGHNRTCTVAATFNGKSNTYPMTITNILDLQTIVVSGASEVDENSTSQYTATAHWDDGSSGNVSSSSTWNALTTGYTPSPYASIDGNGLMTTSEVPSDQATIVQANYLTSSDTLGMIIKNIVTVPAGLILLYDANGAGALPTGWAADYTGVNRLLNVAGNSYSPNEQGGNNNLAGPFGSTSTNGIHSPGFATFSDSFPQTYPYAREVVGDHYHDINSINYLPAHKKCLLIKAQADNVQVPPRGVIMSAGSFVQPSPVTLVNNTDFINRYIYIATNNTIYGSVGTIELSTSGSHTHLTYPNYVYPDSGGAIREYAFGNTSGAHNDSVPISSTEVTENIKRVRLSMWWHASQSYDITQGMIGMWESLTPPDGWAICDGNNGTPDLRDCFIYPTAGGSENTTPTGNNTLSINMTRYQSIIHGHASHYNYYGNVFVTGYHDSWNWSHTHQINKSSLSYLPKYYSLIFIMKLP